MFHAAVPSMRIAPGEAVAAPPRVMFSAVKPRSSVCALVDDELSLSDRMVAAAVCVWEAVRIYAVVVRPPPALGRATVGKNPVVLVFAAPALLVPLVTQLKVLAVPLLKTSRLLIPVVADVPTAA